MTKAIQAAVIVAILITSVAYLGCEVPAASPSVSPPVNTTAVIDIRVVVEGLDTPWAIDFSPDGRMFISERPGRIRVVVDGQLLNEPWLSLDVAGGGESGLLGLVLDPEFARNRFIYVAYTYRGADGDLHNRLVRLREDPLTQKGGIDKILVDGVAGSGNHDGGRVKFGPDGKLYWAMGDAQNSQLAQTLSSLNGKILRLNPDGSVPADNPFSGSLVYSYGHRNPQGLAWQPGTDQFYATEHGPGGKDEINYIEPGKNYGWPLITGDETREGIVSPIIQSGGSETWAPSGATFVTQGSWSGSLLFAGLRGETLYRLTMDTGNPGKVLGLERYFAGEFGRLRDVVEGPDKVIYLLTGNSDGRGRPSQGDDKVLGLMVK